MSARNILNNLKKKFLIPNGDESSFKRSGIVGMESTFVISSGFFGLVSFSMVSPRRSSSIKGAFDSGRNFL